MGDKRTTLPTRKSYHTKSNRMQVVKTPGGKLVMHVVKKRSTGPKCGDTGVPLHGVKKAPFCLCVPGLRSAATLKEHSVPYNGCPYTHVPCCPRLRPSSTDQEAEDQSVQKRAQAGEDRVARLRRFPQRRRRAGPVSRRSRRNSFTPQALSTPTEGDTA